MDDSQWMPPDPNRVVPPTPPTPGADPVPPPPVPALPSLPSSHASWASPGAPAAAPAAAAAEVLIEPVPSGPRRRPRSRALVGGAVVAVLALGAAGVFAVSQYTGGSAGGAASPSELGNDLMAAIEQEDVLGMVDTLLPGERDVMRQPLIDLVSELTRLDVLTSDADLADITGFDVELVGESVSTQGTNVADIVQVDMYADATVQVDGSVVPIGDLITDNMDPEDVTEMRGSIATETEQFDVSLTAVEDDGRWYFSLFHTAAEAARTSLDPMPDIPLEGVAAEGAESPEAAFDQMLDRLVALDIAGLIGTLNPGEAAALQRYAPLFLDDVEDALAEVPVDIEITSSELRAEGDGDTRTVFVDALAARGSVGPQGDQIRFEFSLDGDCVTASVEGDDMEPDSYDQCLGDPAATAELDEMLAESPNLEELLTAIEESFADMEPVGFEMRQYDGAWYASPTTTVTEAVLKFLRALDRQEVDRLIELGAASFEELLDLAFGGTMGVSDEGFADDYVFESSDETSDFDDGGWSAYPESTGDEMTVDEMAYETVPASVPGPGWERCYSEDVPQAAIDCFQQYVDSGELDADFVPVELRHPECGYADVRWTGDIYSLGDAEFIAAAQAAQPCFMALVAAGLVDEFELPNEITHLECFEGRNWYNTFDDPEYDARYEECVYGVATSTLPSTAAP